MTKKEETVEQITLSAADRKNLAEGIHKSIQEELLELDKLYTPFWGARNELVKNIISVASASIVLTVTFSNSLVTPEGKGAWKYLLLGSWISFLLSIISAVLSLWLSTKLRTIPTAILNQRNKILQVIDRLDVLKADDSEHLSQNISRVVSEGLPKYDRSNRWAGRYLNISLVMFILALILLGLFGWVRFAA